jgi:hypothetical protein
MKTTVQDSVFFCLGKTTDSKDYAVLGLLNIDICEDAITYPFKLRYNLGSHKILSRSYDRVYMIPAWMDKKYGMDHITIDTELTSDDFYSLLAIPEEDRPGVMLNNEKESMIIHYPMKFKAEAEPEIVMMISDGKVYERSDIPTNNWSETELDPSNSVSQFINHMISSMGLTPSELQNLIDEDEQ